MWGLKVPYYLIATVVVRHVLCCCMGVEGPTLSDSNGVQSVMCCVGVLDIEAYMLHDAEENNSCTIIDK